MEPVSDTVLPIGISESVIGDYAQAMNQDRSLERLDAAYLSFLRAYSEWGGHRFYGWTQYEDPKNYLGPMIWSEADCVLRFAFELEREFPEQVHLEVPMARWTLLDYDKKLDARQYVDLVVSDFSDFKAGDHAQESFLSKQHELFVEVKYFRKSAHGPWKFDLKKKLPSIAADIKRLALHVERGHCRYAAMLVVDDGGYFEEYGGEIEFGPVVPLVISQRQLDLRL